MAVPISAPFALTTDNVVNAMTNGSVWVLDGTRTITWSISGGLDGESWPNPSLTLQVMQGVLSTISEYANVRFQYVGSYSSPAMAYSAGSNIDVFLSNGSSIFQSSQTWARGHFPSLSMNTAQLAGDLILNQQSGLQSSLLGAGVGRVGAGLT